MIRLLALGDSYTVGEGVNWRERWPERLAHLLRIEGFGVEEPDVIAQTGWTTDELSAGIDRMGPRGPYALVTLMIGVNNQYRGRDSEEYRREFVALLERSRDLAGGRADHVLVLSIPDWSVTPFAEGRDRARIAGEIDRFNAINHEEAERLGARYLDVTTISRRTVSESHWFAPDGLHPGERMHLEWAKAAVPASVAILRHH
ncbi:MAG: SGNH/GDSL hydrolase family protein [Candidatus Eisenbacteria bacterium]